MAHPFGVVPHSHILVGIFLLVYLDQVFPVVHADHFVRLPVNDQQLSREISQLFLVVEVVFNQTPHTAHQSHRDASDRIEGGHQDQERNVSVSCQEGSASTADGPAHDPDIAGISAPQEVVVEHK